MEKQQAGVGAFVEEFCWACSLSLFLGAGFGFCDIFVMSLAKNYA